MEPGEQKKIVFGTLYRPYSNLLEFYIIIKHTRTESSVTLQNILKTSRQLYNGLEHAKTSLNSLKDSRKFWNNLEEFQTYWMIL